MAGNIPLTSDAITQLLKQEQERSRGGGGGRKKKDPTEPREYSVWFKLNHIYGTCSNPDCLDDREGGGVNGHAMVANVKEHDMCRYCFLVGWLSNGG